MKRITTLLIVCCLSLLVAASTCFAQNDQLYRQDFPSGGIDPFALAFDGTNIWVSNGFTGNVSKLRASDGANLGTFPVGTGPEGLVFDGTNIWVTSINSQSNTLPGILVKLRASDGAYLGSFTVGALPRYVAFDGANVWVTNQGDDTVTKLRASDGATIGTYSVGARPQGVLFDGANIWVVNGFDMTVTKLRPSDGATLGTFYVSNGGNLYAAAFDGANVWVTNSNVLKELSTNDGAILGTFSISQNGCGGADGLAFDGANIWVSNTCEDTVTELRTSDGFQLGVFAVGLDPIGVVFDGTSIWTSNWGDGTVTKLTPNSLYKGYVQPPINSDGSSVFRANRGVVPAKFTLTENDASTCALPPATISVTRTAGGTPGPVDENTYVSNADSGSNFRIDPTACQYAYNLAATSLGVGTYRIDIRINGIMVGHAVFALK